MKVSLKYDKKQCWLLYNIADSADALYHADYMDVQMDELCLEKAYSIGKYW